MPSISPVRRIFMAGLLLAVGFVAAPASLQAQTPDSAQGTAPSTKLSTPPDAAPINQPGAMRRAYSHPPRKQHKPASPDAKKHMP